MKPVQRATDFNSIRVWLQLAPGGQPYSCQKNGLWGVLSYYVNLKGKNINENCTK